MADRPLGRPTCRGGRRPRSNAQFKEALAKPRKLIRKIPGSGVILTETELGKLLYLLYPHEMKELPSWSLELTVFFTHGKGPSWGNTSGAKTVGIVSGAYQDVERQLLVGAVLIDMAAVVGKHVKHSLLVGFPALPSLSDYKPVIKPEKSRIVLRRIRLSEIRYEMMFSMAHELYHCFQCWLAGEKQMKREYFRIMSELFKQRKAETPRIPNIEAYSWAYKRNPLEEQASFAAENALRVHKADIRSGAFDKYLPMNEIHWYINNQEEIFSLDQYK